MREVVEKEMMREFDVAIKDLRNSFQARIHVISDSIVKKAFNGNEGLTVPEEIIDYWVDTISAYFNISREEVNTKKRRADGKVVVVRAIVFDILEPTLEKSDFAKYWGIHRTTLYNLPVALNSYLSYAEWVKRKVDLINSHHNLSIKL